MRNFLVTTDTSCDILRNELDEKNVPWVPLTFTIDDETSEDNFSTDEEFKDFYKKIRAGAMPTTSQITAFTHENFFEAQILKGEKNIIHLPLSSGLSGTYDAAVLTAANLMEKYPGTKIHILDTLSATQGNAYIIDESIKLRDSGATFEDAVLKLTELGTNIQHWIIVDDLMHLKRGGRVSGAAAYIGSLLKIKPILILNDKGKLAVVKKIKGSVKAFMHIMDMIKKYAVDPNTYPIYLSSADADDKAETMATFIKDKYPDCEIKKGWVGPVIGAHTGSGMLGVIFYAKKRLDDE